MAGPYYHFTSADNLPSIQQNGIFRGDVPTSPTSGFQAPWLTADPSPQHQQWTLGGAKSQVRLTIEIPDENDDKTWPWLELANSIRPPVEDWWLEALNSAGGGGQERWYVYLGVIEPEWIISVEYL
jgi:hypothetical protein